MCYDIIQIVKGVIKDVVFRKGHMATREDIPALLSAGKDRFYVWEKEDGVFHENDATEALCDMYRGWDVECSQVEEGKIGLTIACDGLLKVDSQGLKAVDGFGQMMTATRHGNFAMKKGDKLTGTRIILLVIEEEKMETAGRVVAEAAGGCPILELKPFLHKKTDIIITDNEMFCGHIQDTFTPVVRGKFSEFDTEITDHVTWDDGDIKVTASTLDMIQKSADVIVCAGGMGMDPDDKTPLTIRNAGVDIVSYGTPMFPGAMFLLACYQVKDGENPRTAVIMGLPGCVMYIKCAISGPVPPRIMVNDQVATGDLVTFGQGGLCLNYPECAFPNRGFGKGM